VQKVDGEPNDTDGRIADDQTKGTGGRSPLLHFLSYIPSDRYYRIFRKWRHNRKRASDRRARVAADHETLRQDWRRNHVGRGGADCDLRCPKRRWLSISGSLEKSFVCECRSCCSCGHLLLN